MKLLRRLEVEPILLPVLVKKILNLNSLFDTWQKLDTFVSGCSFGEFNRQEMPVWEWNQSGTQLQQKEFQQTIKEREEKRKPCYKNSPAKCNYSEFGLLPSTPEGILLFAEFSECNLVPKENQKEKKQKSATAFTIFSVLLCMRKHMKDREIIVLLWKKTETCKADVLSMHKRDWLDTE